MKFKITAVKSQLRPDYYKIKLEGKNVPKFRRFEVNGLNGYSKTVIQTKEEKHYEGVFLDITSIPEGNFNITTPWSMSKGDIKTITNNLKEALKHIKDHAIHQSPQEP